MINPSKPEPRIAEALRDLKERKNVEFKPSLPWPSGEQKLKRSYKAQEVIRSILGMSNIRNGGLIILGVKRNRTTKKHFREGMKKADLEIYDPDQIFDCVRNYGSPEPRFEVKNIQYEKKYFIVFVIQDFLYSPIICRNNKKIKKLANGAIYIRTHKPETKKIGTEEEMREVIDLAVEKELDLFSGRLQRFLKSISLVKIPKTQISDIQKFKTEIGDVI